MAWAVAQDCQNAGEKLVLIMLANYCNSHTGRCNPSHKRLAEECSMGVSTLKRHLSRLEEAGYLKVVPLSADGVSLPNQYDLTLTQTGGGGSKSGWGSAQIGLGVGPNRATNLETNQEDNQKNTHASRAASLLDDIPKELVRDFLIVRKAKRQPLTETAVATIRSEAKKAGISMADAIRICCENSWAGFKASWDWQGSGRQSAPPAPVHIPAGGGRREL